MLVSLALILDGTLIRTQVANETLGYFITRIFLFMKEIGIDMKRIRFRQHLANEMAHYACDCWDCELQTSYGELHVPAMRIFGHIQLLA